jgi:6-phosphogluconolactonase
MTLEVLSDVESVARRAAEVIAGEARAAVKARGRCTVAISGGRTPWVMLRALSS